MLKRLSQFGLVLCLAAGFATAQKDVPPPPKPAVKSKPDKPVKEAKAPDPPPSRYTRGPRVTSEKAIAADPNVVIKLCVADGSVKINGTERNEVRVFVREGRKFEFKSREKNPETGKANWLWITSIAPTGVTAGDQTQCLAGDSVELDVPMKATINLEARTSGTEIDSVLKVNLKLAEGNVSLRNIHGGITAETYQGNVTLENSTGAISVETSSGNVLAYDVAPGNVGNLFRVKTKSGNISFQNVTHRQIEADSFDGSVRYSGKLLTGGIYKFKSSYGSVGMLLPSDASCRVIASYGFGNFDSMIPIKIHTENVTSGGKRVVASVGKGDLATLDLSTIKGTIAIQRAGSVEIP